VTPGELKSIRQSLGLSAEAFAKLVRVSNGRTVRYWESGDRDIPGPVIVIAEGLRDSPAVRDYLGASLVTQSSACSRSH
jgi:DNA-binding transcriptional regulator YiaG